ncbi:polysaccharide deacetylase family protein [Clostridium sp. 19966]|uniref:polysaccharide deacetylase family protein n=1 Tax=Clostridium sp. 19966 TaxID=2768166 RepID=UPI0028E76201|nr:polysaccharide deacetylase family protein [Clostridium sp. 19966]
MIVFISHRKKIINSALILLLIAAAILISGRTLSAFMGLQKKVPIYSVDTKEKKLALTFDVSWKEDNMDEILDILHKYNVKATFFIVGVWIDGNEEKLKRIFDEGHEIGNHTNSHPSMPGISKEKLVKEIDAVDEKIEKVTGKETSLFRFPSGEYSDSTIDVVSGLNKYSIQWDVDSIDWRNQGADIEYNRVIKKSKPGSIILFHSEAKYTPENLPKIIQYLKNQNYEFVTVSNLIYRDNYRIDSAGKQISNK